MMMMMKLECFPVVVFLGLGFFVVVFCATTGQIQEQILEQINFLVSVYLVPVCVYVLRCTV